VSERLRPLPSRRRQKGGLGVFETLLALLGEALFFFAFVSGKTSFPKQLKADEEASAIARMTRGDREARDILILHNMRLVAHIVKKYQNTGYDSDDLISYGTLGLIKAVDTFRPDCGTAIGTYAARCIENEIRMVLRATRKQRNETSLQEPIGSDKEGNEITINDVLGTAPDLVEESVATHIEARNVLHVIREQLPQRERDVMEMRYGLGHGKAKPQREIAQKLGISRSYVSRIEKRAVGMIHHAMEQNAKKRETASAAAKKLSS